MFARINPVENMKRPHLVHFLAIVNDESITLKASITMKENHLFKILDLQLNIPTPTIPYQALRLLNAYQFTLKIVGLDAEKNILYSRKIDSDSFGNIHFKIPLNEERKKMTVLQIYEVKSRPGLEIHLGSYIPIQILSPKKLVICDFDKTLVDTKYSTTKEVFKSLTKPLSYFPTVPKSLEILLQFIKAGHHPFILSASPHFYEDAMRDWLYQNNIFSAGIFLKDYRQFLSPLNSELTRRDIKKQGLYKLNHLLDILIMTGIPDELILMGDNYESDPLIYLTIAHFLREETDPWTFWNEIKEKSAFLLQPKQNAQILNKLYQVDNLLKRERKKFPHKKTHIEILIRKRFENDGITIPEEYTNQTKLHFLIHLYS